jgi:hypothetical protein
MSQKTNPLPLFHLSFRGFLLDKNRCSNQFWIDEKTAHNDLFVRCLKLMSKHLRRDICDLQLPGALAAEVEKSKLEEHMPLELLCAYQTRDSGLELHKHLDNAKYSAMHHLNLNRRPRAGPD